MTAIPTGLVSFGITKIVIFSLSPGCWALIVHRWLNALLLANGIHLTQVADREDALFLYLPVEELVGKCPAVGRHRLVVADKVLHECGVLDETARIVPLHIDGIIVHLDKHFGFHIAPSHTLGDEEEHIPFLHFTCSHIVPFDYITKITLSSDLTGRMALTGLPGIRESPGGGGLSTGGAYPCSAHPG